MRPPVVKAQAFRRGQRLVGKPSKPLVRVAPGQDCVKAADLEVADPPGPTGRQNPAQGFGPQADALGERQPTDAA